MRPLCKFSLVLLLLANFMSRQSGSAEDAAGPRDHPDETANNTSASSTFRAQSNGNAEAGNVSKIPLRTLLYPGSTTRIYVRYMPWFGDPRHMDVGYRSNDPNQVGRQVEDMASRGIQGAIVDWYGPEQDTKNDSTINLMKQAERHPGFEFAISEDAGALSDCAKHDCDVSGKLINDLSYVTRVFASSPAYMRVRGRPAIFFFGLEKYQIDWKRVRRALPLNPLLVFRNSGAFNNPDGDGAYSWVAPETVTPSDPLGLEYLDRFYQRAREHPEKFAMGSAYKGFNDSLAGWGKGRAIEQQCGQTWLATFAEAGKYFSSARQLSALILVTWNDYEEGTEIETGIENCVSVSAELRDRQLGWSIQGRENTVDHYVVMASHGNAAPAAVAESPRAKHSADIDDLKLPPGKYFLSVEAVGRAGMRNHFSNAIEYTFPAR
jgi:hypothetical protein